MAIYDVIPTSNVTFNDIRDTLNSQGGSVNNNVASAFKTSSNINYWSKKKPVHVFNTPFCQDFNPSAPNYKEGWWTSWDGNCGFVPKSVASYKNIPEAHDDGMNGWVYELPEGGERDPLRLGDFAGYYPKAIPIVTNFAVTPSTVSNRVGNFNFGANCLALVYPDDKQLTFADFPFLGEYYFGMVCVHDKQGLMYRATATTKVKDGGYIVQMNANGMVTGEYTCYPFLTQYQLTQSGSDMGGKCYTLPNLKKQALSIVETQVFIRIVCKEVVKDISGYTVKFEVWASNFYSAAQTIKNNSAYIRWIKNSWGDSLESPERQQKVPDFTIPAANSGGNVSKVYYTGEFEVTSEEFIRSCKLMVECGNGSYRNQSFVPIPSPEYNNLLNQ